MCKKNKKIKKKVDDNSQLKANTWYKLGKVSLDIKISNCNEGIFFNQFK